MSNSSDGSITKTVIDAVTGNLANDAIDFLQRKVEASKPVQRIKEKLIKDNVHKDAKRLLELAFTDVFRKLTSFSEKNFKGFFADPINKKIIITWILQASPDTSFDISLFNIASYIDKSNTEAIFEVVLKQIFESINNRKKQEFSPETLNIISLIENLRSEFQELTESIYRLGASVRTDIRSGTEEFKEVLKQELSKFHQPSHLSLVESSNSINYTQEIELIKGFLEKGKIFTARNKALELKQHSEKQNLTDAETNFLINAYIAETFITGREEDEAIPYLEEAATFLPTEERGFRSQAIANLIRGDYKKGLEFIDKSLSLKTKKAEALNIKAQLLFHDGNTGAAEQLLDEKTIKESTNPSHLWVARGTIKVKCGKFDDAIISYDEALTSVGADPDISLLKGEAIILKILQDIDNNDGLFKLSLHNQILNGLREELSQALQKLDEERKTTKGLIYHQRAIVNFWLGKYYESKSDSEEAIVNGFDTIDVRKCLTKSLIKLENFNAALEQITKMRELGLQDDEAIIGQFEIYLNLRDPDSAIKVVSQRIIQNEPPKYKDLDFWILLIEALYQNFETDKADGLLLSLENLYANDARVQLVRAKHLKRIGDTHKAKEILETALKSIKNNLRLSAIVILADIFYEERTTEGYLRAAELYAQLIDFQRIDSNLKKYVIALYHGGKQSQCFRACEEVIRRNGFIELFAELQAAILFNTNNFRTAAELLKQLANNNQNKPEYRINYGICLYHLGERDKALQAVRQAENFVGDKPEHLAFISAAYQAVGKTHRAIELAYHALDKKPNNPNLHRHYISLFLMSHLDPKSIDEKYITKYKDCLDKFDERFPGQAFFQKFQVPDDPNQFKEEFLRKLSEISKGREHIESLYQQNKLPLGLLAKAMGRDLITTWGAVVSHPYLKVWTSSGARNDLNNETKVALGEKAIIIDPVAILTLKSLDLLSQLVEQFEKVYVVQPIVDLILERIEFEKLGVSEGQHVVWEKDGQLYRIEISAQEIKMRIAYLQEILNIIKENERFEIIGMDPENVDSSIRVRFSRLEEALDKGTAQSIFEAHFRKVTLYAEDFRTRQLAKHDFEVNSFGTQAFLNSLYRSKLINHKQYHMALAKLLIMNYNFISIDVDTLKICVEESSFSCTPRALEPFESLRDSSNEIPPLINIASSFLNWLWNENIPIEQKYNWTDVVLNAVTDDRFGKQTGIVLSIRENLKNKFSDQVSKQFDKAFYTWDQAFGKTLIRMFKGVPLK